MSAELEAKAVQIALTPAVREQLHIALERLCDSLIDEGRLGAGINFTVTPMAGTSGKGDELAVTVSVQLCPMYDGVPCGNFVLADFTDKGGKVH